MSVKSTRNDRGANRGAGATRTVSFPVSERDLSIELWTPSQSSAEADLDSTPRVGGLSGGQARSDDEGPISSTMLVNDFTLLLAQAGNTRSDALHANSPAPNPVAPGSFSGGSRLWDIGWLGWLAVGGAVGAGAITKPKAVRATTPEPPPADTTPPVLTLMDSVSGVANPSHALISYMAEFSERVTGLGPEDIIVRNGRLEGWYEVSYAVLPYTRILFGVVPDIGFEGDVTVEIAAGAAIDLAGNPTQVSSVSIQRIDLTSPRSPTMEVIAEDEIFNLEELSRARSSSGFPLTGSGEPGTSVLVEAGRGARRVPVDDQGRWQHFIEAGDLIRDSSSIQVRVTAYDLADNRGPSITRDIAIDTVRPEVRVDVYDDELLQGESMRVDVTFSEPVEVFPSSSVSLGVGAVGTWSSADGGVSWTTTYVPPVASYIYHAEISVNAGAIVDFAGNPSEATHSERFVIDTIPDVELGDIVAGIGGFVIDGECAGDLSGLILASLGDVNGDGFDDIAVGAPAKLLIPGKTFVVFGGPDAAPIRLSDVSRGVGGFAIDGEQSGSVNTYSVGAAGDLNGDGLDDLIVGAPLASGDSTAHSGRSYVIYGKTDGGRVSLAGIADGDGGFLINSQFRYAGYFLSGKSVASAGDFDGDGLGDIVIGAPSTDLSGTANAGRVFLVFGSSDSGRVELSDVLDGMGGFALNGDSTGGMAGYIVNGAGDVNGDGLGDLMVGAPTAWVDGVLVGRTYIVFGTSARGNIELSDVAEGRGGFAVNGSCLGDFAGQAAPAGDVNGDGLADLIVGSYRAGASEGANRSAAHVIFGKTSGSPVDFSAIDSGTGGFSVFGLGGRDLAGHAVAGIGDINGDGLADFAISAPYGDAGIRGDAGRVYVVFGKNDSAPVELSAIETGQGGFALTAMFLDLPGAALTSADLNGDGISDIVIGTAANRSVESGNGRTYVVFGTTGGAFEDSEFDQIGSAGNDNMVGSGASESFAGGAGADRLSGGGGADILYGGVGNDQLSVNASNIAALVGPVSGGRLARVDGGGGIDTLAIDGGGVTLNLSAIPNVGGGMSGSTSRLESIERIDLTGSGNNALVLGYRDVVDLSGMNVFGNAPGYYQLMVDGNGGDSVTASGGWRPAGNMVVSGATYAVFLHGDHVQLLVDLDVSRNIS